MRGMNITRPLLTTALLSAALMAAALMASSALAAPGGGIQAGTSGGVHGDVQIAKAEYAPPQRQIGHQIGSGEPIYMGDQIATGPSGGLQVMLLDQTVMTLGQNAKMTIDEMVYDPKTGTGKLDFNVTQGAFRFVSGQIAKANPDNVNIKTPMATIGIRGTIVGGSVDSGNTLVALLGPGSDTNTSARHGAIDVTTPGGSISITRTGYSTVITPGQPPTPPAPVTAEQLQRFGQAGAGSSAAASTANSTTQSSTQQASSQQASTSQQQSPQTPQTTGSAGSVTGESLASGATLSLSIGAIVSQQQTSSDIAKNVATSSQSTDAQNNANSEDNSAWASLIGSTQTLAKTTNYSLLNFCGFDCGGKVNDTYAASTTSLTMNSMTSWTLSSPSNGSDEITASGWTTGASGGMPSGTKTASGNYLNSYDETEAYVIHDLGSYAGLTYMKFGTFITGDTALGGSGNADLGVFAFGVVTPTSSMPTGSASYEGSAAGYGQFYTADGHGVYAYYGTATLSANFDSHTISGTITPTSFSYLKSTGSVSSTPFSSIALLSGTISGNTFSGSTTSVSGSSSYNISSATYGGSFYGTSAAEAGGTYSISGTNNNYVNGSFGTKKVQ